MKNVNRTKINDLWSAHTQSVVHRFEAEDTKALDKLAKILTMPRHVRRALDWGYTRAMIGSGSLGQTQEAKAKDAAYKDAGYWVLIQEHLGDVRDAGERKACFDRLAQLEGSCAGYLFAAKEMVGQ